MDKFRTSLAHAMKIDIKSVWQLPSTFVVLSLSMAAWLLLIYWSNSNYQQAMSHGDWRQALTAHSHEGMASSLLIGGASWMLMVIAMMFPATIPATRFIVRRARLGAVLIGYLCAWLLFGALIHMVGMLIQSAVGASSLLNGNSWLISVAVLVLAGVYQLSENKASCMQRCEFYCGTEPHLHVKLYKTWFVGWQYGLSCIGCCWAVMLLMFVAWPGSVLWMFVLSVLMVAERFLPLEAVRVPLSVLYLLAASTVTIAQLV